MSDDVGTAEYWNALYLKGDTGWDKGGCAPPISRLLREPLFAKGARLAVIGAGRGHEALEAARLGFRVTAVDFAEEACRAVAANAEAAKVQLEVLQEDLFALPKRRPQHYDAVLEHTCFCAIPIDKRPAYVEATHGLLKKGGVLFGLFYAHGNAGGPPYDTSEAEVRGLFSPHFELGRLEVPKDSFSHRAGKELEAVFTAR